VNGCWLIVLSGLADRSLWFCYLKKISLKTYGSHCVCRNSTQEWLNIFILTKQPCKLTDKYLLRVHLTLPPFSPWHWRCWTRDNLRLCPHLTPIRTHKDRRWAVFSTTDCYGQRHIVYNFLRVPVSSVMFRKTIMSVLQLQQCFVSQLLSADRCSSCMFCADWCYSYTNIM
jgi:hypothetical protein